MKTIVVWTLLVVIVALGAGWYLTGNKRITQVALARVRELESEQNGADSAALRSLLVDTPQEKVKDELMKRVAALRDSADVLRDDIQMTYDSVTPAQEHEIDHIRRHATELESLAGRSTDKALPDQGRLELYRRVVMTYGAGSFVTRQMRREIGLPRRQK